MTYTLYLTPADPEFTGSLRAYAADLDAAVAHFNGGTMRNPKSLRLLEIQDRFLLLELKSELELPAPAKALRLFTQYLLKFSDLRRWAITSTSPLCAAEMAGACGGNGTLRKRLL